MCNWASELQRVSQAKPVLDGIVMSATAQVGIRKPVVLRNSRVVIALLLLASCVGIVSGAGFGLLALGCLLSAFTWGGLYNAGWWVFGAIGSAIMGAQLWSLRLSMARNRIRLTSEGVYFHLNAKKQEPEVFFAWGEVTRIAYRRSANVHYCSVVAKGGREVDFSSFTFVRPKHVARIIAAYAGQSLEEV